MLDDRSWLEKSEYVWIIRIVYFSEQNLKVSRLFLQESEGDEEGEGEDEIDDEVEDDAENESGAAAGTDEAPAKPEAALPPVFREPERQLSKKEIKKKELADLEAVLAQFKIDQTEEKEENGATLTIMAHDHVMLIHTSLTSTIRT